MARVMPMGRMAKAVSAAGSRTTLGLRTLSIRRRPMLAYTGVIRVSQRLDNDKLRNGTRTIQRRKWRCRAYSRMMPT